MECCSWLCLCLASPGPGVITLLFVQTGCKAGGTAGSGAAEAGCSSNSTLRSTGSCTCPGPRCKRSTGAAQPAGKPQLCMVVTRGLGSYSEVTEVAQCDWPPASGSTTPAIFHFSQPKPAFSGAGMYNWGTFAPLHSSLLRNKNGEGEL